MALSSEGLSCEGHKGNWIALYAFGILKAVASLVLLIVGIMLMSHLEGNCDGIGTCYVETGYEKCGPGQSSFLSSCWKPSDFIDCSSSFEALAKFSTNFGLALLVGGLVGIISGVLGVLAALQKLRRWLGISMGLDIFLMIFAGLMFLICSMLSTYIDEQCLVMQSHKLSGRAACWNPLIDNLCAWSDLFSSATFVFFVSFLVELGSAITDCTACCCCPPIDAHWSEQNRQVPGGMNGGVVVVGNPVGAAVIGQGNKMG